MKSWIIMLGIALIVYGFFRLISGVWGPDAIQTAGANNTLTSAIIIGVGLVGLVISLFLNKKTA